jgi:hypothetical protein
MNSSVKAALETFSGVCQINPVLQAVLFYNFNLVLAENSYHWFSQLFGSRANVVITSLG